MSAPDRNPANSYALRVATDLGAEIEAQACQEQIDVSQLLWRALLSDRLARANEALERFRAEAPPTSYTEEDVPRLIREVREEVRQEELRARRA